MYSFIKRRPFHKGLALCLLVIVQLLTISLLMYHQVKPRKVRKSARIPKETIRHTALFDQWLKSRKTFCEGRFVGYNAEFVLLQDVVVDRDKFLSKNKGGENLYSVINQREADEYFQYRRGAFSLLCDQKPAYHFTADNHLERWIGSLEVSARANNTRTAPGQTYYNMTRLTIAVQRYEYVNLYHTMTDWYNAYLLRVFFYSREHEPDIVLVDAHPAGCLDDAWSVLFHDVKRLKSLPARTRFSTMVWGILGYHSPLSQFYDPELPLVEEFRSFFLSKFSIDDGHELNCEQLNILFIWRRNYVTHPRNPKGKIARKFSNEAQLLGYIQKIYPSHNVRGIQIDQLPMNEQLQLITSVDILIGIHGAGLTHALFLPQKSALIELFPRMMSLEHFRSIARWRKLIYSSWSDTEEKYLVDSGLSTKVPPVQVHMQIAEVLRRMCPISRPTSHLNS